MSHGRANFTCLLDMLGVLLILYVPVSSFRYPVGVANALSFTDSLFLYGTSFVPTALYYPSAKGVFASSSGIVEPGL